jgi:hypothetical protein
MAAHKSRQVGTNGSPAPQGRRRRRRLRHRRGVASVLAMMFVVMFGSLAVAMAIVSQGNLRTAQTHLHVQRALSAAETGMAIAVKRLDEAAKRFVISKGLVDSELGWRLWSGTTSGADGTIERLPPVSGFSESSPPAGIVHALQNAFGAERNVISMADAPDAPIIGGAIPGMPSSDFRADHWLTTPAIGIDGSADDAAGPAAFQVTYAPLAGDAGVRIIVTGYSSVTELGSSFQYSYDAHGQRFRPVSRVLERDVLITKRHNHAVVSPSRIMIGKNVQITGKLGAAYTDVTENNGHPLIIKSDFLGLSPALDTKLNAFFARLPDYDVDGDNRLRIGHSVEGAGIPVDTDTNGDGIPDGSYQDATGDGFLDEFDIFLNHYDTNHDGKVVLSAALTAGTPATGMTPEFTGDDDLALLLDSAVPDRNHNGVSGYDDANHNGRWDPGETLLDHDAVHNVDPDRVMGYRDGVIDRKDQYAKVRGRLVFKARQQDWTAAQGNYQRYVRGTIAPPTGESAVRFEAPEDELPALTQNSFTDTQTPLEQAADGQSFNQQVATALEIPLANLPTYTESDTNPAHARYYRMDLSDSYVVGQTGQHIYERMPFNAPVQSFYDWYYRPRFENITFRNVQIPRGTNGLFVNCTFIGVTWVRSYTDNTHPNWSLYGRMQWSASQGHPVPQTEPLDKSDFQRYLDGDPTHGPANYNDFPDPPVIDGVVRTGAARDTKQYSNNLRFHNCTFVGSIVSDSPSEYTHSRNKIQFTGGTRFLDRHPTEPDNPQLNPDPADEGEIAKSSMMLPGYSVDIGSFNSPTDTFPGGPQAQNVKLNGTIVAGVLDVRGNANIDGTLLLTFAPVAGQGPLQYLGDPVGNPAQFNATLGYFGPADGDGESLDPTLLPPHPTIPGAKMVGWDTDGDGIADVAYDQPRPAGSSAVPFYGYGRIFLNWNPDLPMPDGIMLPLSTVPVEGSYKEGLH